MKIKLETLKVNVVFYISSNDVDLYLKEIEKSIQKTFPDSYERIFKDKLTASTFEVVYTITGNNLDDEFLSYKKFFKELLTLFKDTEEFTPSFTNQIKRDA